MIERNLCRPVLHSPLETVLCNGKAWPQSHKKELAQEGGSNGAQRLTAIMRQGRRWIEEVVTPQLCIIVSLYGVIREAC